jgi:hypothetical protein
MVTRSSLARSTLACLLVVPLSAAACGEDQGGAPASGAGGSPSADPGGGGSPLGGFGGNGDGGKAGQAEHAGEAGKAASAGGPVAGAAGHERGGMPAQGGVGGQGDAGAAGGGDPQASSHGDPFTIKGAGFGTKPDNNVGNYAFFGRHHLAARFTDFDNAKQAEPATNSRAGWEEHLDGIFPIVTSTDFNAEATASGATVQLAGGPTPSGRWLKRQITQSIRDKYPSNVRLRNWNLWATNEYRPQMYVSVYVNLSKVVEPGKFLRFYFTDAEVPHTNVWTAKLGAQFTARTESSAGGLPGIYADPPAQYVDDTWARFEILADFENDSLAFYADGIQLKDSSRGYDGDLSGWLGKSAKIDYFLLSNTIEMNGEAGEFVGHAMPYLDFSFKRIELADAAVWEQRTRAVVQPPTSWSDGEVSITVNQGPFPDLKGKFLFYLEGTKAIPLGALP